MIFSLEIKKKGNGRFNFQMIRQYCLIKFSQGPSGMVCSGGNDGSVAEGQEWNQEVSGSRGVVWGTHQTEWVVAFDSFYVASLNRLPAGLNQ